MGRPGGDATGQRASGSALRWPFVVTLGLGLGIALAPVAFQMFTRAPKGGDMIDAFRPYMTDQKITRFQRDMRNIDAAVTESHDRLEPLLEDRLNLDGAAIAKQYALYADFTAKWKSIDADMSDMLRTMRGNLDNFAAVDALPPFKLFPWFFVVPGVLVAGGSIWALLAARRAVGRAPVVVLVVLGLGLVAAPVMFQMFTRAPKGGEMIDDFSSLMTKAKVQRIQGYFLVIGAGEGTIRNQILTGLEQRGGITKDQLDSQLPALQRFSADWPSTSNQMSPMIGAMSDNVDNYLAAAAMPPFPLFPWFFVFPGLLVAGLAFFAGRGRSRGSTPAAAPTPPESI